MKKNMLSALAIVAVVFSIVLEAAAQTEKMAMPTKKAEIPGLLYKISGKNLKQPSYLFGTIHVICSPDMIPMEKMNGYLDQTEQLILEVDMDNTVEMQAMQKSLVLPDGKTFTGFYTPEQLAKVDELLKTNLGVSVEQVKTLKPIMLQTILITSPKVLGCSPPASYELEFVKAAAAKKKPVEGLETVASQLEVLNKTPLEKQAKDLYEMALDPQKSFTGFKKLLEIYKTQNSDSLYDFINSQMEKDREFQTRLLDERNISWIPKIETAIKGKSSFIAVGGGHLGGKNGVINLLRAKGYQVQAIKL